MEAHLKYPIKIIYAEDNPLDIDLTKQIFANLKHKFDLNFVLTGKELLEEIKQRNYDLILLDNHLPDVEGVDLIPKIKSLNIDTPIVILTGLGDEDLVLKAIKFGASDYIAKSGDYLEKLPDYLERVYILNSKTKTARYHVRIEHLEILYIEHDLNDINLLDRYLKKETPYIKLTYVTNSIDALNLINERDFDLILIDLRMPDIDGIELVRRIKHKKVDVPIIIVTGKGDEKSAIEAMKLGVYDYVIKDIDYIERLPRIIEISYLRYKYDKSLLNHERKFFELQITLEQQYQEKTISLIKEIERRKESEEKYFELYKTFENFLNTLTDLVIVKDKDLKVRFVNTAFENFFELKSEQIYNNQFNKNFREFERENAQLDFEVRNLQSKIVKLIKIQDKTGEEKYFEVIKSPIFNESNEFNGIVSIYRELTTRIKLENQLRYSEERYKTFIENSSELIASFELKEPVNINQPTEKIINEIYRIAKLSECNDAFVQGHGFSSIQELNGYPIGYFIPLVSEQNRQLMKEFISNNFKIKNHESKELTKDGSIIYFAMSMNGIIENEKLVRIWIVKRDITELKKFTLELEDRVKERTRELELLNKELESFNSAVSHDLKAPLRAIVGFGEMILRDYGNQVNDEVKDLLNDIITNGKKLQVMLEDLLRLSKISLVGLKLQMFSMNDLIEEIIDEFRSRNELGHVKVIIEELPEIYADKGLIKISFTNLISNAIKFSLKKENPLIEITNISDEKNLIIVVKDNGAGFDMKYLSKLFQPFQRLHTEFEFPGAGIGLAIVKRIIDKHNGTIWAESIINEGSKFYVSIPKTIHS
ncbi:MAG: response regulator [Ignavibacteria bacterium]|nr:response regulator [Ignavibacteria bacterium]